MTVAYGVDEVRPAPSVVSIGVFDGVHRGHRTILDRAVVAARQRGVRAAVVTFDPHPAAVVGSGPPPALQSVEARVAALEDAGVDLALVLPFTRALAQHTPEAFVAEVLAGPLRSVHVVVGANFRFGHRAAGDVARLAELGASYGFTVDPVPLTTVTVDGAEVSSTAIRERLAEGDVAWAARALGRPFEVAGEVVRGDGRGRSIGVPTANLSVAPTAVVPAAGVYAGRARLEHGDRAWDCVVNVGTRPTFGGDGTTVEAHLLDADVDLYGRRLVVAFSRRLRDERRFDGVDALVGQIRRDIASAREHL